MVVLFILSSADAQTIDKIIKAKHVKRIEKKLSSDEMLGRRTFTPGIEKASAFIKREFKKIGLLTFNGAGNYRQEFFMHQATTTSTKVIINGNAVADSVVACFSYQPQVTLTEKSEVEIVKINKGDKFGQLFYQYYQSKKNLLVLVDSSFNNRLKNIQKIEKISAEPGTNAVVFVFGITDAINFTIDISIIQLKRKH